MSLTHREQEGVNELVLFSHDKVKGVPRRQDRQPTTASERDHFVDKMVILFELADQEEKAT